MAMELQQAAAVTDAKEARERLENEAAERLAAETRRVAEANLVKIKAQQNIKHVDRPRAVIAALTKCQAIINAMPPEHRDGVKSVITEIEEVIKQAQHRLDFWAKKDSAGN